MKIFYLISLSAFLFLNALKAAKYVDLTHTITPSIPVWAGFGASTFAPAVDPKTGPPYSWANDGFEATRYVLATDQLGTQLDPPAHWNPYYPSIGISRSSYRQLHPIIHGDCS